MFKLLSFTILLSNGVVPSLAVWPHFTQDVCEHDKFYCANDLPSTQFIPKDLLEEQVTNMDGNVF